ncbi:hypothetical protein EDB19DRAFT_1714538 [Suillus lakei]|nr:hypothetical protein EDB19DRAFT_1714538 [Suillus lakei]
MPKDNIHYGGRGHRDVHNINGVLFVCPSSPFQACQTSFSTDTDCHPLQANHTFQATKARTDSP